MGDIRLQYEYRKMIAIKWYLLYFWGGGRTNFGEQLSQAPMATSQSEKDGVSKVRLLTAEQVQCCDVCRRESKRRVDQRPTMKSSTIQHSADASAPAQQPTK